MEINKSGLSEKQLAFLRLLIIEAKPFAKLAEELSMSKAEVSLWYEELREYREELAKIRALWTRKKFTETCSEFFDWYKGIDKCCHYCGINESEIQLLLDNKLLQTKRIDTRGKRLEYDRKESELPYSRLDNIVLCCYWCNNAKTDTFTFEEFKAVGKVFSEIWKARLSLI